MKEMESQFKEIKESTTGLKGFNRLALLLILSLAAVASGCIPKKAQQYDYPNSDATTNGGSAANVTDDATFKIGDQIQVKFSGVDDAPKDRYDMVSKDGSIDMDLIGRIDVAGKTRLQLQEELKDKYGKFYKRLTVTVLPNNRYVYVHGQVRVPDRYAYEEGMSVLQAVTAAKGFTDYARRAKVQVTRDSNREVIQVDCLKALDDPSYDVPVYSGDTIYVPRRYFTDRI
jgi:protein involved in polysaccharide export with SLBB domain